MAQPPPRSRQSRRRPLISYTVSLLLIAVLAVATIRNWGDVRTATGSDVAVAIGATVAIIVVIVLALYRSQVRARSAAPRHGWGGLAMVSLPSLQESPSMKDVAPSGALGPILLSRGLIPGRLIVSPDEVHFEPGPRGRMAGSRPFRIPADRLRNAVFKDRMLALQIRGEPTPVVARVVQGEGLAAAVRRLRGQGRP